MDGDPGLRSALDSESGEVPSEIQPPCYTEHPKVQEARALGKRLPVPLAVYLDGVAFTSVMAGRSDTVLGIWVICLATFKRHLFAAAIIGSLPLRMQGLVYFVSSIRLSRLAVACHAIRSATAHDVQWFPLAGLSPVRASWSLCLFYGGDKDQG